jgi:serine/threonine protein kinase
MRVNELHHENLIAFKEYFEDAQNLYLVMECAGGGELFDRISARGKYTVRNGFRLIICSVGLFTFFCSCFLCFIEILFVSFLYVCLFLVCLFAYLFVF